jgi:tetratricopeptide (TPR) repeat protein
MSNKTVTLDARRYVWTGARWYGATDYLTPPVKIVRQLNALIAGQLMVEDDAVANPDELLDRAKRAQEAGGQLDRALRLARRACGARPGHVGSAAVLCSILRETHRPEEALAVAERFRGSGYPPILTSRAAALCDLGRWEEAIRQIRQVLAIGMRTGTSSGEALAVYSRIKAGAPGLLKE